MTPLGGAGGSLRDQGRLPDAGLAGDQRRPGLPTLRSDQQLVDALELSGTAGEADTLIYDADLKGPMALVMGAEGQGMRRLTREHCDFLVKIDMAGEVSSLNVSVATGVCLFEAVRQRKA